MTSLHSHLESFHSASTSVADTLSTLSRVFIVIMTSSSPPPAQYNDHEFKSDDDAETFFAKVALLETASRSFHLPSPQVASFTPTPPKTSSDLFLGDPKSEDTGENPPTQGTCTTSQDNINFTGWFIRHRCGRELYVVPIGREVHYTRDTVRDLLIPFQTDEGKFRIGRYDQGACKVTFVAHPSDVTLKALRVIKSWFRCDLGYTDYTPLPGDRDGSWMVIKTLLELVGLDRRSNMSSAEYVDILLNKIRRSVSELRDLTTRSNFRYFSRLFSRSGRVSVQWEDEDCTTEDLADLYCDLVLSGEVTSEYFEGLVERADGASEVDKQSMREVWYRSDACSGTVRRSARRHPSSQPSDTEKEVFCFSKRRRVIPFLHCPSCGILNVGDMCRVNGCDAFLCCRCRESTEARWTPFSCHDHGGQPLDIGSDIKQFGLVRPEPVRVQLAYSEVTTELKQRVEMAVSEGDKLVDIIVIGYHSQGLTEDQHVIRITDTIAGREPKYVLVLTCHTESVHPALRTVALLHPSTIFVTFYDKRLPGALRFDDAIPLLTKAVLHREAPPFTFLYLLCSLRSDIVFFMNGHPSQSQGPLRVVLLTPVILRNGQHVKHQIPPCYMCGEKRSYSTPQYGGVRGVKRRNCQTRAYCGDLLIIRGLNTLDNS